MIAIELAPEMIDLYDEALGQLDEFLKTRLADPHPERSSALARGAETILAERQKRWPHSSPPIAPNELEFLIGMLEMNAGHVAEAQQRFEKSLEKDENAGALTQLGLLLERGRRPEALIDIDPRKIGKRVPNDADGVPVLPPEGLPAAGRALVLSAVGSRGSDTARSEIRQAVAQKGYVEGVDFWALT